MMVFALASLVTGSVLIIGSSGLGWTLSSEDEWYVLGVCMGGVYVSWM